MPFHHLVMKGQAAYKMLINFHHKGFAAHTDLMKRDMHNSDNYSEKIGKIKISYELLMTRESCSVYSDIALSCRG